MPAPPNKREAGKTDFFLPGTYPDDPEYSVDMVTHCFSYSLLSVEFMPGKRESAAFEIRKKKHIEYTASPLYFRRIERFICSPGLSSRTLMWTSHILGENQY